MNLQEIEIRPFSTSSLHETFLMEVSGRFFEIGKDCLLYTSPSPRDGATARLPSSA